MKLKRRILWFIWAGTAVLSVLAFIPVPIVVVAATFILFVPTIVLACPPNLLLLVTALLVIALLAPDSTAAPSQEDRSACRRLVVRAGRGRRLLQLPNLPGSREVFPRRSRFLEDAASDELPKPNCRVENNNAHARSVRRKKKSFVLSVPI
jgi:hypothetical protein